jgi:hypothetical protein
MMAMLPVLGSLFLMLKISKSAIELMTMEPRADEEVVGGEVSVGEDVQEVGPAHTTPKQPLDHEEHVESTKTTRGWLNLPRVFFQPQSVVKNDCT